MAPRPKDPPLVTAYRCPTCEGAGVTGESWCSTCRGRAVVGRQGDWLLYWGRAIDDWHLRQRQVFTIAEHAVLTLLLCFAALGAGSLLWELSRLNQAGYPLWQFYRRESVGMLTFWMSVLSDSYLVFHFAMELSKIRHLPRRAAREAEPSPLPDRWEAAVKVPRVRQFDLAQFYSAPAVAAVEKAWLLARRGNHQVVAPLHLLVSILTFPATAEMFVRLGVSFDQLRRRIIKLLPRYAVPTGNRLSMSAELREVLLAAYAQAFIGRQKKVDLPELLEACVKTSELVRELLYDLNVDGDKIANVTVWLRVRREQREHGQQFSRKAAYRSKHTGVNRTMTAVATPFLDHFSQDLTQLAKVGFLEPCQDREREVAEMFRVLAAGARQNVLLVGNPGIGKRAIINGIARRMVAEEVPPMLQDKRLVSISVARLISGVSPSEAQERLLHCLSEAQRSGNIIVFFNDITKMVGITSGGGAALDLAGALAQAMTQTGLQVIATALPADYARYLENHALGQVMEKVDIEEPEANAAIQILEAKAGPLEARYQVFFTYDALAQAVALSSRYLHDRFLPEKAIEILDETAVRVLNEKGRQANVGGQDVARTVSEKTNIPLTDVTQQESEKLLRLEDDIHQRVVDQEEAVTVVSAAIRRARAELRDTRRPIVNLLFLGPTGVGKTELAKTVAAVYFGRGSEMIRLDMSEYQEQSSVNRLLGAPPGFSGAGSGGYLTEAVRRRPFALVLLDEIEKAHPEILNLFLQVMDDGRLTDAVGRTIDFTNVILIATSNACTPTIQRLVGAGVAVPEIKEQLMGGELQQHFRPEFLNRFDSVVVFKPLGRKEVRQITRLMLAEVGEHLEAKGIALQPTEAAIDELAAAGFDPQYGARPLRRVIQERVDDVIATKILRGELQRRDTIVLDVGGSVTVKKPAVL
ncbi:MAG: ATPase AAA-2 domain protein [Parcubacteria group bacterium Gr01-1014_31]|nr:MAG: ATPase AAA-2 domain protein [Parcubacteria group bacterium Gr01-1014_31]